MNFQISSKCLRKPQKQEKQNHNTEIKSTSIQSASKNLTQLSITQNVKAQWYVTTHKTISTF
jgi:hypothetical protein